MLKRIFDIFFAMILSIITVIPMLVISIFIKLTSAGPVLYWSVRVGKNNIAFSMPKFRTMNINAPEKATHLLEEPEKYITYIGSILRRSSLDELPQLWSIIRGDMSFVGPRPALFNQYDLIELRTKNGIHSLIPGLTGWAQINGRDDLPVTEKVEHDLYYLNNKSFMLDIRIITKTILTIISREGVIH